MKIKQLITLVYFLFGIILLVFLGISQPDTIVPALNGFLMIGVGLFLGFFLKQRWGLSWGLFGVGGLTFIASQVLHIPFNQYLLNPILARLVPQPAPGSQDLLVMGLLLGLSAGLFEETARYLVLRFWRKDVRTWKQSLMFGAGHAGVEAIILGLIVFISFIQLLFYRNFGTQGLETAVESVQLESLQSTLQLYWSANWYEHLWGSLERFSVISVHLAATVLVYQSLRRNNILWYLAAVLWHTIVDLVAVYAGQSWGIPITEAIIFGFGALGWGIVFLLRDPHPPPGEVPLPAPEISLPPAPLPQAVQQDQSITKESLDESRYE